MGKIETATQWMIDLANDDSHGYDQDSRWGPDYDCSSSVISAWQYAGVPVKTKGASSTYDMKNVFLSCGFTNVISSVNVSTGAGLKRGDVLHRSGHTAMYIGNNKQVAAHLNEKGTTKGGKTGDQTGKEISVSAYSNSSSNPCSKCFYIIIIYHVRAMNPYKHMTNPADFLHQVIHFHIKAILLSAVFYQMDHSPPTFHIHDRPIWDLV